MKISFKCKTNKDYCAINTAKFVLPNGTTLTIDRTRTEWSIVNQNTGELIMTWFCCYLWAINDNNIFTDEVYNLEADNFADLVADARVIFELEEDIEDEDYEVDVLEWGIFE